VIIIISDRIGKKKSTNETKSWFFEKINKIDKPFVRLTKKKGEQTGVTKVKDESGLITTDVMEVK
jgi:hypothetical protein